MSRGWWLRAIVWGIGSVVAALTPIILYQCTKADAVKEARMVAREELGTAVTTSMDNQNRGFAEIKTELDDLRLILKSIQKNVGPDGHNTRTSSRMELRR